MGNKKKQYSNEFKQESVNYYYTSGKSISEVARNLKIGVSTLSKWIKNAKENQGQVNYRGSGNLKSDEAKENAKLKKELRDANDALEILKKAIGILGD